MLTTAATALWVRLALTLQAVMTAARPTPGVLAVAAPRARAVSFFEYAILAAIIVVIGVVFRGALSDLIKNVFEVVTSAWDSVMA